METAKHNTVCIRCIGDHETIHYAGQEFVKYIKKIDQNKTVSLEITPTYEEKNEKGVIWLGLTSHFTHPDTEIASPVQQNDTIHIDIQNASGIISGINPRSVLLGVYQFLTQAGCRWIRPRESGELIPAKCFDNVEVHYSKEASYKHRGVCIEGSNSLENVLDMIEWLPKIGCNAYFIQFRESFTFFERWYTHKYNPFMTPGTFSIEEAGNLVNIIKEEIRKRSLLYHAVGHGWTCEPFGLEGTGWDPKEYDLSPEITQNFALVNGKREVWQGIPINTNLCYTNEGARETILHDIESYLESHKEVDYLHFWLADGFNNHCECEHCVKISPSDIYVQMLNELDLRLTKKGIDTKIVFLIYFELLWPPQKEIILNEDRFTLMFAPITRTYSQPFSANATIDDFPEYVRNQIVLPKSVEDNLSFLFAWNKLFSGDSFDFDYHLYFDHYNDPSYYTLSKIIHSDVKNLKSIGMHGLMSCQVQRAFLPNSFPMHVMFQTLWDDSVTFETIASDYFLHAYGEDGLLCETYLSQLAEAFEPPYLRNEREQVSKEAAARFTKIPEIVREFTETITKNLHHNDEMVASSWKHLEYHSKIYTQLALVLACKANGQNDEMDLLWQALKEYVLKNEVNYQEVFDVQMFISTLNGKFIYDQKGE